VALDHRFIGLMAIIYPLLAGCVTTPPDDVVERPGEKGVSIITGSAGGFKLSDLAGGAQSSNGMPVNALLWRAALDIADEMPLADSDVFGGSIYTEWYQTEENPNQRLKLAMFVVGRELRSDAIKVHAYFQNKQGAQWIDAGRDESLGRKLEGLVLARARELRSTIVVETVN
jgi:hypothetical protein